MTASTPQKPPASTQRHISWIAASNLFQQVLGAVSAFLRPALLAPELFGVLSVLRLVPTVGQTLHLGARSSMRFLIPSYEADRDQAAIGRLKGTVLRAAMAVNVLGALVLLALAAFTDWSVPLRAGLAISALTLVLNAYYDHFVTEMKGHRRFGLVAVNSCVSAVALLAFSVGLILWLGFYGALLAPAAVAVVMIGFLAVPGHLGPRPGFDRTVLRNAIAMGGPTLLFDLTLLFVRSSDRFVIAHFLGFEQLGYYGLGGMLMGYLMNVPGASRIVLEAKLFQTMRGSALQAMFEIYVMQPMLRMGLVMVALIGPVVLALPVVIPWLLPNYAPGVKAMQVLALGGYFLGLSYPIRGILVANKWQFWGAGILAGSLVLHLGLSSGLLMLGHGIEAVSLSAGLSFLAGTAAQFIFVVAQLPEIPREFAWDVVLLVAPFPAMLAVLVGEEWVAAMLDWPPLVELILQIVLYGSLVLLAALALRPIFSRQRQPSEREADV